MSSRMTSNWWLSYLSLLNLGITDLCYHAKLFFIISILFFTICVFPPYFVIVRNFFWDIVWACWPPNFLTFPFISQIRGFLNKGWSTSLLFTAIEVFYYLHHVDNIMLFMIPYKSSATLFQFPFEYYTCIYCAVILEGLANFIQRLKIRNINLLMSKWFLTMDLSVGLYIKISQRKLLPLMCQFRGIPCSQKGLSSWCSSASVIGFVD